MSNVGWATLTIIPSAKGFRRRLSEEIGSPLGAVGDDAGKTVSTAMSGHGDDAGHRFSRLFGRGLSSGIGSAFGSLRGQIAANIQGVVVVAAGALAALPLISVAAAGGMVAALSGGFAAVGLIALATTDKMKKRFGAFKTFMVSTFRDAAKPLQPVLDTILSTGHNLIKELAPSFKSFFKTISGPLSVFVKQLGKAFKQLEPVLPPLADAFTRLLKSLGPKLPSIFQALAGGVIAISDAIAANPKAFVNLVVGVARLAAAFLRLFGVIAAHPGIFLGIIAVVGVLAVAFGGPVLAIAGLVAAIIALATTVLLFFPQIKKAILTAVHAVVNFFTGPFLHFFTSLPGKIRRIFNQVRHWIGSKLSQAWHTARRFAGNIVSSIVGFFSSLPGKVGRFFARVGDAIRDRFNDAVGFVRGIPGRILSALGNLGGILYGAGRSIITGLIHGIESAFGWLRDKLSFVTNIIPSWKGPLSVDRKLLAPAGRAIMGGLIGGIQSETAALQSTLGLVTSAIANTPMSTGSPGLAGVGTASGATVNVFPREGQSEDQIGRIAAREIAWQGRSR